MNQEWDDILAKRRGLVWVILLVILLVGSYFRLAHLGDLALRTDEGNFLILCLKPISFWEVFDRWLDLWGSTAGQFPFSMAFTKGFLDFFHLPITYFWVRFPSALWGIAMIPIAYGVGREIAGRVFGLALALVVALNPYHIQDSRDAYYTVPMVCGAFLGLWSALWIYNHIRTGKPLTPWFYVVNALGFFLLTYAQASGWPLALLFGLTVLYGVGRDWWKSRLCWKPLFIVVLTFLAIGVPLLFAPWALKDVLFGSSVEVRAQTVKNFGQGNSFLGHGNSFLLYLRMVTTSYAWGSTPFRAFFTTAMICLAIGVLFDQIKKQKHFLLVWAYLLAGFAFGIFSLHQAGKPLGTRYLIVLLPLYLTVLTTGIMLSANLFRFLRGNLECVRRLVPAALLAVAIGLWCEPAYLCTKIINVPTPYKDITTWVDANLPRGTLILVDRWLEAWCELRTEPATNVVFTYTYPNHPVDIFKQIRWRDTATNFFSANPDAAYLEVAKMYWEDPSIGPWEWPRQFFARHTNFVNPACMRMRDLGLAKRDDYYAANTNRLVVELFYNTQDDVLAKAKAQGQSFLVLYGAGWGYWKNGQGWNYAQNMDYRDWRILQDTAQLDLFNLTDKPTNVFVTITGASTPSAKEVEVGSQTKLRFAGSKLEQVRIGPIQLTSGHTVLSLLDQHWTIAKVTLLVSSIGIEAAMGDGSK